MSFCHCCYLPRPFKWVFSRPLEAKMAYNFCAPILVVGLVDVHWGLTDSGFDPQPYPFQNPFCVFHVSLKEICVSGSNLCRRGKPQVLATHVSTYRSGSQPILEFRCFELATAQEECFSPIAKRPKAGGAERSEAVCCWRCCPPLGFWRPSAGRGQALERIDGIGGRPFGVGTPLFLSIF